MKKKMICLIIMISFCLFPFKALAITIIDDSKINCSPTPNAGCVDNSCWKTFGLNVGKNYDSIAFQSMRVTIYDKNGKKVSNSVDFANSSYQLLDGKTFYSVSAKKSKVDYIKEGDNGNFNFSINKGASINYLDFPNFIDQSTPECKDLTCLFKNYINKGSINLISQAKSSFSFCDGTKYECNEEDVSSYYMVVEPTTVITLDGNSYYGTYYELKWLYNTSPYTGSNYNWARTVVTQYLPYSLMLTGNDWLKGFYDKVKLDYSDNTLNTATSDNNDIFGIGVLNANGLIPPPDTIAKKETCVSEVDINSCGNLSIKEPTSEACILGNNKYYLDSYGDSGKIYCTNNVSSSFNNFYNTFSSTIRSGSYFPMNELVITTDKTCYISTSSNLSSVTGWESTINENLSGNIKLSLGNRVYTLEEHISSSSPTCVSKSNGVCTKATLTSTHRYNLNPLVNKYINIETMQQDNCDNEDDCSGVKININNGGARLTIPLNYLNGTYKYNLNFNESLLSRFESRIADIPEKTVTIGGKKYKLIYNTNKSITEEDLNFSCRYKANRDSTPDDGGDDGCKDEYGNLIPCPDGGDDCGVDELPDDKCCIDKEIVDCPTPGGNNCHSECCDENDKPISCPGDSFLNEIVYRPISLIEPFPGINGIIRTPGSNWNKVITFNGTQYSYGDYYIKNNRGYDGYDVYQAEPLYVINLDGSVMDKIREYNKKHKYDDFNLECINGENCVSNFLRGKNGFDTTLISGGTCKEITSYDFGDCITRKS